MNDTRKDPPQDHLLEHDVDGIREYDNPLPKWWVNIFWVTILYAVLYWLNVIPGIGEGKGRLATYERDVAAARELRAAEDSRQPSPITLSDEALFALARDPARTAAGRRTFETTCAPCHRADGGGGIGPNRADEYWIHGPLPTDAMRTVHQGVLDKGMPAWSEVLSPGQVADVVAYSLTLRGTHPPDPKAPQGLKAEGEGEGSEPH